MVRPSSPCVGGKTRYQMGGGHHLPDMAEARFARIQNLCSTFFVHILLIRHSLGASQVVKLGFFSSQDEDSLLGYQGPEVQIALEDIQRLGAFVNTSFRYLE